MPRPLSLVSRLTQPSGQGRPVIPAEQAQDVLKAVRAPPGHRGRGRIAAEPEPIVLHETCFSGTRIVDMLVGICFR